MADFFYIHRDQFISSGRRDVRVWSLTRLGVSLIIHIFIFCPSFLLPMLLLRLLSFPSSGRLKFPRRSKFLLGKINTLDFSVASNEDSRKWSLESPGDFSVKSLC